MADVISKVIAIFTIISVQIWKSTAIKVLFIITNILFFRSFSLMLIQKKKKYYHIINDIYHMRYNINMYLK